MVIPFASRFSPDGRRNPRPRDRIFVPAVNIYAEKQAKPFFYAKFPTKSSPFGPANEICPGRKPIGSFCEKGTPPSP